MSSLVPKSSPSSVIFNLTLDPREVSSCDSIHNINCEYYNVLCCKQSCVDHPAYFAGVKGQIGKKSQRVRKPRNEATYVCECISDSGNRAAPSPSTRHQTS